MTARTVNGSIKIREKHKIFKETGSPFDATPIHSIKVRWAKLKLLRERRTESSCSLLVVRLAPSLVEGTSIMVKYELAAGGVLLMVLCPLSFNSVVLTQYAPAHSKCSLKEATREHVD